MSGDTEPGGRQGADGPGGDGDPFDTSVAHSARVHDYWLGGKDNYAADRAAGDAVIAAYREPPVIRHMRLTDHGRDGRGPRHRGSAAVIAVAIAASELGTSRASWRLRSGPPKNLRSTVLR